MLKVGETIKRFCAAHPKSPDAPCSWFRFVAYVRVSKIGAALTARMCHHGEHGMMRKHLSWGRKHMRSQAGGARLFAGADCTPCRQEA